MTPRPTIALSLLLALCASMLAPPLRAQEEPAAEAPAAEEPAAEEPAQIQFETYQLVLLKRPADREEIAPEKAQEIQAGHMAHLGRMAKEGHLVAAGPFGDQDDDRLRGLALYRVGSVEEARRLAEQDPAVQAGRLEVEVMTWYTEKGALAFPLFEELTGGGEG